MKKRFVTIYQTVMSALLVMLWISMAVDGRIQTFDGGQWGIMIVLSVAVLFAVGMLQIVKNDMEKQIYELQPAHEDAVDYEYEEMQPPAGYCDGDDWDLDHTNNEDGGDYFYYLPEYALASTSSIFEETYVFVATEHGDILTLAEIGRLAERWGDENWTDADATIAQLNTPEHMYVFVEDLPTGDDSLKHRLYRRIDKIDAELNSFELQSTE